MSHQSMRSVEGPTPMYVPLSIRMINHTWFEQILKQYQPQLIDAPSALCDLLRKYILVCMTRKHVIYGIHARDHMLCLYAKCECSTNPCGCPEKTIDWRSEQYFSMIEYWNIVHHQVTYSAIGGSSHLSDLIISDTQRNLTCYISWLIRKQDPYRWRDVLPIMHHAHIIIASSYFSSPSMASLSGGRPSGAFDELHRGQEDHSAAYYSSCNTTYEYDNTTRRLKRQ